MTHYNRLFTSDRMTWLFFYSTAVYSAYENINMNTMIANIRVYKCSRSVNEGLTHSKGQSVIHVSNLMRQLSLKMSSVILKV